MEVRTFEALSMKAAIRALKRDLGNDAVILQTKEKIDPQSNQKIYEITASSETSSHTGNRPTERSDQLAIFKHYEDRFQGLERKLDSFQQQAATRDQVGMLATMLAELKHILTEERGEGQVSVLKQARSELREIDRQMSLMGLELSFRMELAKFLLDLPDPDEPTPGKKRIQDTREYYRSQAMRWMIRRLEIAPEITVYPGSTSIHMFVGSTGVGKTGIVAKLAQLLKRRDAGNILLVSFDTQRIAASEQLRVYAKLMNLPFETISEGQELSQVITKHPEADLVLVDTSGRSAKSTQYIQELEGLNQLDIPIETHLVLSLTEKPSQMEGAVRAFSPLGLQSLFFTKMDEAWSYGEIFNLANTWRLPLSYFSTGPKLKEDFERASKERVIERIFGA